LTSTTGESQEIAEIRGLAREFAAGELRPHVEQWDHAGALPDAALAQLAELGFFGMLVSEAHGGMAFDTATFTAAVEELAWGEPAAALLLVTHAAGCVWLDEHGGDAAREWLPELAAGARTATAPIAGDDAAAADGTLRAAWLPRAERADFALGRLADGSRFGCALEGARFATPLAPMGLRPLELRHAEQDAAARLAAAPPAGSARTGVVERIGAAAVATGIAAAALDHARDYAAERHQFGRAIRDFEGIALKLADMRIRTAAARALVAAAAGRADAAAAAEAKVFAADAAMWVTTQAVQIFGGYGYMRDYPVEKLMRDARAMALLFDDNDALRLRLADGLYAG
jgi:alkylation response protein AidB-like acyl-CoA dehydrogenase